MYNIYNIYNIPHYISMQYIFKVMCIAIEICTVKTFLLLPIHHLPGVERTRIHAYVLYSVIGSYWSSPVSLIAVCCISFVYTCTLVSALCFLCNLKLVIVSIKDQLVRLTLSAVGSVATRPSGICVL